MDKAKKSYFYLNAVIFVLFLLLLVICSVIMFSSVIKDGEESEEGVERSQVLDPASQLVVGKTDQDLESTMEA